MKPVNVLIAAVAVVVVGAVGYTIAPDSNVNVTNNIPPTEITQSLGAQSVQMFDGTTLELNGLKLYPLHQTMRTSTTTICSLKAPAATTTLVKFTANFTVSSTSASAITMAKAASTNSAATTTALSGAIAIAANALATINATSTALDANNDVTVIAPNSWLTVGMAGGSSGTFSPSGTCSALLMGL